MMDLFAVIPTTVIGAPLAILAMLFPALLGGLKLLGKHWRAFLIVISTLITLCFFYDVARRVGWINTRNTWTGIRGLLFLMIASSLAGALWAGVRYGKIHSAEYDGRPARAEMWAVWIALLVGILPILTICWFFPDSATVANPWWCLLWLIVASVGIGVIVAHWQRRFPSRTLSLEKVMLLTGACTASVFLVIQVPSYAQRQPAISNLSELTEHAHGKSRSTLIKSPAWEFVLPQNIGEISSTPLIHDHFLYVVVNHPTANFVTQQATVCCLDLRKDPNKESPIVWQFDNDGQLAQMFSSPRLSEGRLYFGEGFHEDRGCNLFCLDSKSGKRLWTFETTSHTESTPFIDNGKVYFGAGDDGMFCVDAKTGKYIWQYPSSDQREGLHIDAAPVVIGERVYCCSGVSRTWRKMQIFCLNKETGKVIWTRDDIELPAWAAPTIFRDHVYISLGNGRITESDKTNPRGSMLCLDAKTGKRLWTFDEMQDAVHSRPVVDEHQVYFGSRDGFCYCLDRWSGRLRWKRQLGKHIVSTPVLAKCSCCDSSLGLYIAAYEGDIYCLDPITGEPHWHHDELANYGAQIISSLRLTVSSVAEEKRRLYIATTVQGATPLVTCLEDQWKKK